MYSDPTGHFWHLVMGGILGGLSGALFAAIGGGDLGSVVIGAVSGALSGVLAASGAGVVAQALGSAGISMLANAATQAHNIFNDDEGKTKFNLEDMLFDGAVGLVCGIWGGNGASYGNSGGIMAAGKQLFKRGFFNPAARKYYAETAHNASKQYVFDPLLKSLLKNTIGSTFSTITRSFFN